MTDSNRQSVLQGEAPKMQVSQTHTIMPVPGVPNAYQVPQLWLNSRTDALISR
jgi:hypothetical protein